MSELNTPPPTGRTGRGRKSWKKIVLVSLKMVLAAALLVWVFSQVHFRDYVKMPDGRTLPVLEALQQDGQTLLVVRTGGLFSSQTETIRPDKAQPVDPDAPERVRRPGLIRNLRNVNKLLLVVGIGGFLASALCIAMRWHAILTVQNVQIRRWEAVRLTFLGEFFSQVIPGTVGGDLVKAYYVSRHTHQRSGVLASVFVDRLLGLTGLAVLASVMTLVVLAAGLEDPGTIGSSFVAALVLLALVGSSLLVLLSRRLRKLFRVGKVLRKLPIGHHLDELRDVVTTYRAHIGRFLPPLGLTFLAHAFWISGVMMLGVSLGLQTAWYRYFIYIPLIYIIGAVPITPGGVGLVEKLYLTFFAINPSGVLALALLVRLLRIIVPLPGLVVALTGPRLPETEEIEAELGIEHEPAE